MSKKALYPGSFDPFTNGHLDIVKKAVELFEEVYIVIGMKKAIEETLQEEGIRNCQVCVYEGLVAEFSKTLGIHYMIRGLRNNMDYNYEENIAEVNKLINPDMEYVYFRAENVAVSSSMVKELYSYQRDISKYVPAKILEHMKSAK